MSNSIYGAPCEEEVRSIYDQISSRRLSLADYELTLFLTGVSKRSSLYSPIPHVNDTGLLQALFMRAIALRSRLLELPSVHSLVAAKRQPSSTLSEWEMIYHEDHPLGTPRQAAEIVTSVYPTSVTTRRSVKSIFQYHVGFLLRLSFMRLFSWRKQQLEDARQPVPALVTQPLPPMFTPERRLINDFNTSSGFLNSRYSPALLASNEPQEEDDNAVELVPLLTPLQRAIAQARFHNYHLHKREPLVPISPLSPTACKHNPPGLAHSPKTKYCIRTHQVAAGDYMRKEALNRAAIPLRKHKRRVLNVKTSRAMDEPRGFMPPAYEYPRVRVVIAPRRIPVRLWKREGRTTDDWFEVEERSCGGGLGVMKRDSQLRNELDFPPVVEMKEKLPLPDMDVQILPITVEVVSESVVEPKEVLTLLILQIFLLIAC